VLFDPDQMIYDPEYDNDQMGSPAFGIHVEAMPSTGCWRRADKTTHLVEVGCRQGAFLMKLALTDRSPR